MSKEDNFNLDSIMTPEEPHMMSNDLDMSFHLDHNRFDQDKHLRLLTIMHEDWGRIDWNTGKLLDPDSEPVDVGTAVLYLHGGGWVASSTRSYLKNFIAMSKTIKIPIFSIEYRHAPEYPFPTSNSD